jgi:heme-degrading monooxygenase HmoA
MSIVAMTRVVFDADVEEEVIELGEQAVRIFAQQKGFLGMTQYRVKQAAEIVSMVEWDSELAYRACEKSPDWLLLMPQWCALQEDGEVTLETKLLEAF